MGRPMFAQIKKHRIITGIVTLAVVQALFHLVGCAGRSLQNFEPSEKMASGVPEEILSKFTVQDLPLPMVEVSVSPSPVGLPIGAKPLKPKAAPRFVVVQASPSPSPLVQPAVRIYENRRLPGRDPVLVGEKLVYDVTYLGIPAGELTIEVRGFKRVNGRKVYHFFGRGVSSDLFSVFYKADDFMESFVDHEGLFSHRFHLKLDESKQKRDVVEVYDYDKMQGFYWSRWDHHKRGFIENKEVYPIGGLSQDSFSALFYPRFLDLEIEKQFVFPVQNEGKFWDLIGDVIRREKLDTVLGEVDTIVVRPTTRFQGVIQQRSGESFAWYTDDAFRYLVRMEAKVKIGTVVIKLNKLIPGAAE